MPRPQIMLTYETHHGNPGVALGFDYDCEIINGVKAIGGARWSQSRKFCYIPRESFKLSKALIYLTYKFYSDMKAALPLKFTPMFQNKVLQISRVHWTSFTKIKA